MAATALAFAIVPLVVAEDKPKRAAPSSLAAPPKLLVGPVESVNASTTDEEVWNTVAPVETVEADSSIPVSDGLVAPATTAAEDRPLRRGVARRQSTSPPAAAGAVSHWPRTIVSTLGVAGLIVLLAWGYRAMNGKSLAGLGRPRAPGVIQLLSRFALSPRQSVCLLRVGPRVILVGLSPDRVTTLDVITDADTVSMLLCEAAPSNTRVDRLFQRELEREAAGYVPQIESSSPAAQPVAQPERLIAARTKLLSAIERLRSEEPLLPQVGGSRR